MRKVIVNTTPLIALANIDQLGLLNKLYGTIIVPQAVMEDDSNNAAKSMEMVCFIMYSFLYLTDVYVVSIILKKRKLQ